jgi:hypothetical protein
MELLKAYFRWTIAAKRAAAEPGPAAIAQRASRRPSAPNGRAVARKQEAKP